MSREHDFRKGRFYPYPTDSELEALAFEQEEDYERFQREALIALAEFRRDSEFRRDCDSRFLKELGLGTIKEEKNPWIGEEDRPAWPCMCCQPLGISCLCSEPGMNAISESKPTFWTNLRGHLSRFIKRIKGK